VCEATGCSCGTELRVDFRGRSVPHPYERRLSSGAACHRNGRSSSRSRLVGAAIRRRSEDLLPRRVGPLGARTRVPALRGTRDRPNICAPCATYGGPRRIGGARFARFRFGRQAGVSGLAPLCSCGTAVSVDPPRAGPPVRAERVAGWWPCGYSSREETGAGPTWRPRGARCPGRPWTQGTASFRESVSHR